MADGLVIDVALIEGYVIRELPEAEWYRLQELPDGPYAEVSLPPSDTCRIVVIEQDRQLLGYWVISAAIHLDPLYLDPSVRHHPRLALAFTGAVVHTLQRTGARFAYAVIADLQPENAAMAAHLGFVRVPGALYAGLIPAPTV